MWSHGLEVVSLVVASPLIAAGMYTDVAARRIGNRLNLAIVGIGIAVQIALAGMAGLWVSLAGVATGLAILLPLYALGTMGAGDVKFLAAIGAWTGAMGCLYALVIGGLAAGAYGLGCMILSRDRRIHLANLAMIAGKFASSRILDPNYASHEQLNSGRVSMPCGAFFGLGGIAVLAARAFGIGVLT
jgi:prepilin peptidase CpaA